MSETPRHPRSWLLHFVFFLSGIAGLGYQIAWTRMFTIGLGHEFPSILAVVGAFFGGFALGGWALDGVVSRSRRPGLWYAAMEIVIGAWAGFSLWLIPWANTQVAVLTGVEPSAGRHYLVAFLVPFFALLPATAAMGATLPAMDRFLTRLRREGRLIGGLYGINTLGAMVGTLGTTFLIVPAIGYTASVVGLAILNLLCAAIIVLGPARGEAARPQVETGVADAPGSFRLGLTVFLTGLLGIGYEVIGVRVMGQVQHNTVYSFASVLSIYLLGTSYGAWMYQKHGAHRPFRPLLTFLLQGLALSCLLGLLALSQARRIDAGGRFLLGNGFVGIVVSEIILAFIVFLLPCCFMGATFSHLTQAARKLRGGVGRALGLNTLGGSLAPALFGVFLLPWIGPRILLVAVALAYVLLVPHLRVRKLAPVVVAAALLFILPIDLKQVVPPKGGRELAYRNGVMAAVSVVETQAGDRLLKINKFWMGGTGVGALLEERQGHLPLLLHPDPKTALFLGVGTGITASEAYFHPGLEADAVELVPEVLDMLPYFLTEEADPLDRDNVRFIVADARRFVRASSNAYDVIVADLFQPVRDGSGALYTHEHFSAVRRRLAPGGLFCQWVPLHQFDIEMLRLTVRTFLDVFPEAHAFICHFDERAPMLAMVGFLDPPEYDPGYFARRVSDPHLKSALAGLGIRTQYDLYGLHLAGPKQLKEFAGEGPIDTDDRTRITFYAPHVERALMDRQYTTLERLLETFEPSAESLLPSGGMHRTFVQRVNKYCQARDAYLKGRFLEADGRHEDSMNAYLASIRISSDFDHAYDTMIQNAKELAKTSPAEARGLLERLRTADPSRRTAGELLNQSPEMAQ